MHGWVTKFRSQDINLDALDEPPLTDEELAAIDKDAVDSEINLRAAQTQE